MKKKITLIGAGNVAWHLAPELEKNGVVVAEVFSRDLSHARKLAKRLYDAQAVNSLNFTSSEATLFIIAVPDEAVPAVVNALNLPSGAYVAHTSGALPIKVLDKFSSHAGVFYPLQTFSKGKKVDFSEISIFIESENNALLDLLAEVGYALSQKVYQLSSEERKALHVAAVFACNFTNQLLQVSEQILEANGMELDFLKPLVSETIDKAFKIGPLKSQTGPAVRNDHHVVFSHLDYLQQMPTYREVYASLSKLIMDTHRSPILKDED